MDSTIHNLVLESMDTQLILAEGFIDNTKKTIDKVIDNIIELCRKFISFLKDKFTKGLDATERMITKVKKLYKEADSTQTTPETIQSDQSDRIIITKVAEMIIRDSDTALDIFSHIMDSFYHRNMEEIYSLTEDFLRATKKIEDIFKDKDKRLMKPYHHEGVELLDQISDMIKSIKDIINRFKSYSTNIIEIVNFCKKNPDTIDNLVLNTLVKAQRAIMLLGANLHLLISKMEHSIKTIEEKIK